jgi:DNA-binding NtrC family response regulator
VLWRKQTSDGKLKMTCPDGSTILIVEDDDDMRELLADHFARHGYAVTTVATAESGLERLATGAYGVVLSDNQLSGGGESGAWMFRQADAAGLLSNVGALMYTGDRKPDVPEHVGVVQKPASFEDLERAAERAACRVHSAEEKGFEPLVDLRPRRFSKPLP